MKRLAGFVLAALLLAMGAGWGRAYLQRHREKAPPASLLYLPRGPYLRALALGQEETLADLLYIWSIQYYSNYADESRFEYIKQIFEGAITDLDPRYTEVYLVGAMIMSVEAHDTDMALELLDKGLEKMPENWEIAYWAGWECYNSRRLLQARSYWARAARVVGAPPQLIRLAARMLEKSGKLEDALAEYERILENPPDEKTEQLVRIWVQRTKTEIALRDTRRAVEAYRDRFGRCPSSLESLVRRGIIDSLPRTAEGKVPVYAPESCEVSAPKGGVAGGGR